MCVKAFLHIKQVEVSYVVMAQILMIHTDHLYFTETQAKQQTLKSLEIEPSFLTVAPEKLLDVKVLLLL